jgi:hypothetical protein
MFEQIFTQFLARASTCRLSAASSLAGVVIEIGALVTRCSAGDRIAGILFSGCK